jgi:5-methylcytosine-specific restriction protein A
MNRWIFQSNPSKYDLLADWSDGAVRTWSANQQRNQMAPGDTIFFRVSGPKAGLYALGTILTFCYDAPDEFGRWKVDVRYDSLIHPPLLRRETDHIADEKAYRPLKGQEATNFLVPMDVASLIEEKLRQRTAQVARTVGAISSRQAVLDAMHECDVLGREKFLAKYGFGESVSYVLVHEGRQYDSKAIAGAAYGYQHGEPLTAAEFSGGQATVQKKLHSLGFVVRGSRPPKWVRDELILALDLYVRHGWLDDLHPEVQALSVLLNSLPLHPDWRYSPKFRNPNGVCMKLANFQALDPTYTGTGLADVSEGDREVWEELHDKPELLSSLAASIRSGASLDEAETPEEGEDEALEGRILTRLHRSRERDQKLSGQRKAQRRKECGGALTCEACGFDFALVYGNRGDGFAECHHKVPLSESGTVKTRLTDLAILCANCHRMIHVRKPMLSVEELRGLVQGSLNAVH